MNVHRTRFDVALRIVTASAGAYAVSALSAMWLAVSLPLPRSEAVLVGTMASFVICACIVLWAFAAASAIRAWIVVILLSGLLAGALFGQQAGTLPS